MSVVERGLITVVLCDDGPRLRTLLRYTFEEHQDLRVVGEAGDGQTGVDMIQSLRPDVVILDLSMPGMDGLEAIRRHAFTPGLVAVA